MRKIWYTFNRRNERGKVHMTIEETGRAVYDIGEIKIDGLEPTLEMKKLLEKEKRGEITMEEIREIFDSRGYRMKP